MSWENLQSILKRNQLDETSREIAGFIKQSKGKRALTCSFFLLIDKESPFFPSFIISCELWKLYIELNCFAGLCLTFNYCLYIIGSSSSCQYYPYPFCFGCTFFFSPLGSVWLDKNYFQGRNHLRTSVDYIYIFVQSNRSLSFACICCF